MLSRATNIDKHINGKIQYSFIEKKVDNGLIGNLKRKYVLNNPKLGQDHSNADTNVLGNGRITSIPPSHTHPHMNELAI